MSGKAVTHSARPGADCLVHPLVPLVESMKIITEQMWPAVVLPVQKHVSFSTQECEGHAHQECNIYRETLLPLLYSYSQCPAVISGSQDFSK